MERSESKIFREAFAFALVLAFVSMFSACSDDKVAGGSSDDAGIYAVKDLDVAGVSQKGPFVKGSAVTVQGIDCKTMELTGEIFEGTVKSDKGDFGVDDVNLSATCALFEVTGYYFNEVTGKKSANEVTLHALSDLSDRKHVNINMLTELEYKRVMNLVSEEKMSFDDAKKQAEKEVLASFNVNGDYALSEDLNIFENGDGNAALLAVSVLVQVSGDSSENVNVAERVDNFGTAIAKNGTFGDSAKTDMADWAAMAESNGQMAKIRKNLENLGYADEIPAFENVVEEFATGVASSESSSSVALGAGTSSSSSLSEVKQSSSSSSVILSSSEGSSNNTKDSYLNPNINYGEMTDSRDGQVYKTVKIGDQIWMAQNLNYADSVQTPVLEGQSWCLDKKPENCKVMGRLYTWLAAIDTIALVNDDEYSQTCSYYAGICRYPDKIRGVCPEGWHLPHRGEWNALFIEVGGQSTAAKILKSQKGWNYQKVEENGSDDVGFSVIPVTDDGYRFVAEFWTATNRYKNYAYDVDLNSSTDYADFGERDKRSGYSIRCLKDDDSIPVSYGMMDWSFPKEAYMTTNATYDSIVDSRDNQVYKTVKIGDQVWMAENLNYADSVATPSLKGKSWCYGDDPKKCAVGGRLYVWSAAIDSVKIANDKNDPKECGYGSFCGFTTNIQGICPEGWHLPDTTDWHILIETVGGPDNAGGALKSKSGWDGSNGLNEYGFSAFPVGDRSWEGGYGGESMSVDFWTSTEESGSNFFAHYLGLSYGHYSALFGESFKHNANSIRCVKDGAEIGHSSSSVAAAMPCKTETEDNCESGTLTDSRDGKTYRTVKIGDQVWMAENLNYAYTSIPFKYKEDASDSTSWCYNNDATNCEKYGRLYTWATAMDSSATWSDNGKDCGYNVSYSPTYPVQGICPSGWHLPSEDEWSALLTAVGGRSNAGKVLKSQYEWNEEGNGTDEFGFTALPAGYRDDTGKFIKEGGDAYFWGATIAPDNFAFEYANSLNLMYYSNGYTLYYYNEKYNGLSVRCVKN